MTITQSVFVVPALLAVAHRQGYFDSHGVDVATVHTPSSISQRTDLDDGVVEVAVTATDNLLAWNATGSDVVLIGQIETTTDLALTCRAGLGSPKDAGRIRLAVDAPTNGFAIVAYAMLADPALAAGYDVVEIGGVRERLAALGDGSADVTLLAPPLDQAAMEQGMSVVRRLSDWLPSYPGLGLVTTRRSLNHSRDKLQRYVSALVEANDWMRTATATDLTAALAESGIGGAAAESVAARIPSSLAPTVDAFHVLETLRRGTGAVIDGVPSAESMVETGLVDDAHR
ncbi:hypothetical protein GCM10007304_45800 [Rhodococcoides trifolii]|uniref:SsuA/THI5-like domain-containing protein n=1 Tax=Rhodococcoides trifolii TaxID=908250 RepID=A0A917G7Q4_9NOCA|nr:ABC transporter substrate-binding protein [Rhodococcus trifolii]GGG26863.1 hypothetical protein GCM10007304_45800 [Rhodococcus trifolii]